MQCTVCTVWKNEKFSLTKKIFRQINSLVISLVKLLLSQNFCQKCVRVNFRNFHTVYSTLWKFLNFTATVFSQKFRQINVLLKNFTIRLIWRKKICKAENFSFFHTVAFAREKITWNRVKSWNWLHLLNTQLSAQFFQFHNSCRNVPFTQPLIEIKFRCRLFEIAQSPRLNKNKS